MIARSKNTRAKWIVVDQPDEAITAKISQDVGMPKLAIGILVNRGMDTTEVVRRFLDPQLDHLEDPFSLSGMKEAVERLCQGIKDNEKVTVYGDYDVDGITATSLLYLILNRLGAQVDYYLPNRLVEGYGLSKVGIDRAHAAGVKLIVTVDTGITALEEVDYAKELGIDIIITDHHESSGKLPKAAGIINPKIAPGGYKGGELSGVGVAFKFAQGLYQHLGQDPTELHEHLDLVAMGTSADIVPLTLENRILTKIGIAQIAKTRKPGLKSLVFVSGLMGRQIESSHVIYILAPRINAVGRLGDASMAIRLLTTRDEKVAAEIARKLEEENRRRKAIDEETLNQALARLEENAVLAEDRAIVLSSEGWHQGVIGIVASRLVEKHHLPTVMIAVDNGVGKGSARSIPGFHLCEALKECEDTLLRYGGHKYAAGLLIDPEQIPAFTEKFKQVSQKMMDEEAFVRKTFIDAELELNQINTELLDALETFSPYGPQNTQPIFMTRGCEVVGMPMKVGRNHLRMRVRKGDSSIDTIGFGLGDYAEPLQVDNSPIDVVYAAEYNVWNGKKRIQLHIKDVRFSSDSLNSGHILAGAAING